jgi:methylated-DNA-[protein]-cysteine S-methyltransferase
MAAPAPPDGALINELTRQLRGYFAGGKRGFFLPLSPPGTPFQQRVWAELARIPFGERRTYAQVAEALGGRGLARAVGNACGANPLPIVIPCHRVVASNGGLGGFSGGLAVKRLLLELEGAGGPASRWGR